MSAGPEFVRALAFYIDGNYAGRKVRRADAADSWISLSFSGDKSLLFSWDTKSCGCSPVSREELKELSDSSSFTPPVLGSLRRHVVGSVLNCAKQLNCDRVLRLKFKKTIGAGFTSEKNIIFELTGRYGNLVLTDENGIVIEAAKHVHPADNRYRSTLPGQKFIMPPPFNGIELSHWLAVPRAKKIGNIKGIGPTLLKKAALTDIEDTKVSLSQFLSPDFPENMTIQKIGPYYTLYPDLLPDAIEFKGGVSEAARDMVLSELLKDNTGTLKKELSSLLLKRISAREKQEADIIRLLDEKESEVWRKKGELLAAYLWQVEPGKGSAEINYWDETGNERKITFALDPSLSPAENAGKFFRKYKKRTEAKKRALKLLKPLRNELADLREQRDMLSVADDTETLRAIAEEIGFESECDKSHKRKDSRRETTAPYKRYDLPFAIVFAGLSAKGNRCVTFGIAGSDDIWFHAQGVPGAHVIMRLDSADISDEDLEAGISFCSSLAAWFSRGRENNKQRVDYTLRKYVSPIKGQTAGVTYREFKSVNADPTWWREFLEEIS